MKCKRLTCLPAILGSPAFHETHSNGTHAGELVDSFETLTNRLCEECRKLLIVEYLQITSCESKQFEL